MGGIHLIPGASEMRKIRINEECIHMYILHTCQKLYKVPSSVKGPQKTPPPSEKLGK